MSAQQTEPGAPNTRPAGRAETPPTIPIDLPVGGRELLGVLGQCELVDFEVLSFSGEFAPTLDDRIAVAELATAQFKRFNRVADHCMPMVGRLVTASRHSASPWTPSRRRPNRLTGPRRN
ncbi:hypothetical protein FAM22021_000999 [Propionibacterium freudenreichii]|nr:hypothetical protein [Propionibacterium freudenreichii]